MAAFSNKEITNQVKICFISTMYGSPWGGSEELWFRVAMLALEKNDQVMVSVFDWNEEPGPIARLREAGATIIKRPLKPRSIAWRLGLRLGVTSARKYLSKVREFRPDAIVICHGGTFESEFDLDANQLIDLLKCRLFLISQCNLESGGVADPSMRAFYIGYLAKATKFFFVSDRNRLTAQRQLAHTFNNTLLVSNPASIKERAIRPWPTQDILTMACVARLECSVKGQDILLQVLSGNVWRTREWRLSLYGLGPDEGYLKTAVDYYQLADKVTLKGHTSSIDAVWDTHQLLVLPSLLEGTPLSMIEAMLSGRPVMGTNVGDISRYVISGTTGFVSPAATPEALAETMEQVWNNREYLAEFGRRAFEHAMRITDPDPHATVYKNIIGEK